jgi:hypothetical protein
MLYQIGIQPLTKTQIKNLGLGKGVRVKAGNSPLDVNEAQYKKFHQNMNKGKSYTLKLTEKQGKGIFGDAFRYIKSNPTLRNIANKAISSGKAAAHYGIHKATDYAHRGINRGAEYAHGKVRDFPMLSGSGIRKRTRKGKGLIGDVLQGSAQLANWIDPNSRDSKEAQKWLGGIGGIAGSFGLGMKPRTRRGKGLFGTALKGGAELSGLIGGPGSSEAKQILGGIGDVANFLGFGLRGPKKGTKATPKQLEALARGRLLRKSRKGTKATPKQLEALARGRATRDANRRLKKTSSGGRIKKKYMGSALIPAGY